KDTFEDPAVAWAARACQACQRVGGREHTAGRGTEQERGQRAARRSTRLQKAVPAERTIDKFEPVGGASIAYHDSSHFRFSVTGRLESAAAYAVPHARHTCPRSCGLATCFGAGLALLYHRS